ncbi:short-subunit dehydrogenase [Saccharothrix variisporea]|uniref:Short-subunit dehydrogenase n=1 Tax=Saccharothrix variisporea TaxID=543527 RepID=A0A495WZK4_9PSEU|nr:short-subunit dehydrogenase [Saccharothrix variisporea]
MVTGAARGFGLGIARRLAERGYAVVATDVDPVVEEVVSRFGAHGVVADVRDPAAHRAVADAARRYGRVAVWVNNAGVLATGPVWEQDDDVVRRMVEVNLLGVVHGSRVAVETMRGSGGRILNIASMSAYGPVPGLAVYAATKAAVLNFGTSLQGDLDLAGVPIRVHTLCPDAADTAMVDRVRDDEDSAILFSGGGLLPPDEVADAAVALLDGRRLVRAVPAHRAGMARLGAVAPSVGLRVLALMRKWGEKRR